MDLSIVIPVLNESESVVPLLAEIHAALDGGPDYEVIFVDDASTDDTAARLRAIKSSDPRLRILTFRSTCGKSAALVAGIVAAHGRFIATIDGDGQNDPADIPALWDLVGKLGDEGNAPAICGYRNVRQEGIGRRLASRIANNVRRALLRDGVSDTACGLKLFSRQLFLQLPHFDNMHRFLPALFLHLGTRIIQVEVNDRPRLHGVSKYGLLDRLFAGLIDLFGVRWLLRRITVPEITEIE
jgi:dolichol-phosphate mannosyltransferase